MKNTDIKSVISSIKQSEVYSITTTGKAFDDNTKKRLLLIDKSKITGNYKFLTNRSLTFDKGTYTIISFKESTEDNTKIELTLDKDIVLSDISILESEVIIEKDVVLEIYLDGILGVLNASNSNDLTNYDIPTQNDWFKNNEKFSTILIQNSSAFKDAGNLDKRILVINDFIDKFNNNKNMFISSRVEMLKFRSELDIIVQYINKIHTDIAEYYVKLKKLVINYKMSDLKIAKKETDAMLDTRTDEDNLVINNNYNYFLENGQKEYNKKRSDDMFQIKLD